MLIDIKPRIQKPSFGRVEIDWGHPLANGLNSCWVMNQGGTNLLDLVRWQNNASINKTATTSFKPGVSGLGLRTTDDASAGTQITISPTIASGTTWSWDGLLQPMATTRAFTGIISSTARGILYLETSLTITFYDVLQMDNNTAVTVNTPHHYGMIYQPGGAGMAFTQIDWYLDGKADGSGVIGRTSTSTSFSAMNGDGGLAFAFDGFVFFQRLWSRALKPGEFAWLAAEPYAFLRPKPAITYSFMRTVTAAATTVFRRTLSAHGTRTGSRQVHF